MATTLSLAVYHSNSTWILYGGNFGGGLSNERQKILFFCK